ncbi:MAG TPA: autotransporter outer membrane beta-barrel domain-containing protein, partial [Sphingopyxis sp.]|nr:autotransporter outer membrane beta-barrel domain-containing protein [Sphingopyxis sp.]
TRRGIVTGNSSGRVATASDSAQELRLALKTGAELDLGKMAIRPLAGLSYTHVGQDGFVERGAGDAGLVVRDNDYKALTGEVGLEYAARLAPGQDGIAPYANLSLTHDVVHRGWRVTPRLIGGGNAFRVEGHDPGRTAGVIDAGIRGRLGNLEYRVSYELETRADLTSHAFAGSLSLHW